MSLILLTQRFPLSVSHRTVYTTSSADNNQPDTDNSGPSRLSPAVLPAVLVVSILFGGTIYALWLRAALRRSRSRPLRQRAFDDRPLLMDVHVDCTTRHGMHWQQILVRSMLLHSAKTY